jgi:hypothetical protein
VECLPFVTPIGHLRYRAVSTVVSTEHVPRRE